MFDNTQILIAESSRGQVLPRILWLWVPVLIIVAQIILELSVPAQYLGPLHSEGGPHEAVEFVFAAIACVFSLACAWTYRQNILLLVWFSLAVLGCFYIAGEEISWGQHVFGWTTPEFWSGVNDQNETNLHNTSSWFDQKPRLLLFIGIVVAGLIAPWLRLQKPGLYARWVPERYSILFPSAHMVPTSLGVLVPYLMQAIGRHIFHIHIFERESEVQELYMYYFLLLYTLEFILLKKQR